MCDNIRRPSAKSLLESPYFPSTVKASYLFLAPLHLRAKDGSCLHYAANFAKQGVLKAMGTFAAEMCASFCLSLVVTPLSDTEAEWAYTLLKEFIKSLTPKAVKTIVLPAIQRILQASFEIYFVHFCGTFFLNFLLMEVFVSDYRLFTSKGFYSARLICSRDMESGWQTSIS